MYSNNLPRKSVIFLVSLVTLFGALVIPKSMAAVTPPRTYFCTAGNYVMLADIITNAAGTTITSSVPSLVGAYSSAALAGLSGSEVGFVTNETSTAQHLAAISNLRIAMEAATSLATSGAELISGELSTDHSAGSAPGTFNPGIYKTTAALNIAAGSVITLSGTGFYYFSSGAALTMGAGVTFQFLNGADPHNLYWVAGTIAGDMSLGANSSISGNFMARGTATFGAGAHLYGRLLVLNTITLAANVTVSSDYSDTTCPPRMASVPDVTTKTLTQANGMIIPDFKVGNITYTSTGATSSNNGTVASYSPMGSVVVGTPIDYVIYKFTSSNPPALTISFTDITLLDAKVGQAYSDSLAAVTKSDGNLNSVAVIYGLESLLPGGLSFDTTTGKITGTVTSESSVGNYFFTVTASAVGGYTAANSLIKLVVVSANTSGNSNNQVMSIGFTDVTLVDARAGEAYSDFVLARTSINGSYNNAAITYSITSGSLPAGLYFNESSGYISGIVSKDATAGIYPLTFFANSTLYTSAASSIPLRVLLANSVISPALSINFTDVTLLDGRVGDPYSDYVEAKSISNGSYSSVAITYILTGTLPTGLIFNSATGFLSGTISKEAVVGTYDVSITAMASNYPSKTLLFTFKVAAAQLVVVTPVALPAAARLITFTDTTLVEAHPGRSYADYVKARAFIGSVSNTSKVTYSLIGVLPAGLSFSSSTGYITGSVSKTAALGNYKLTISAMASGYTTQQQIFDFLVTDPNKTAITKVPTPTATPSPSATAVTKMSLMGTVWFDSGKSLLTSSAKASLNQMITTLVKSKYKSVVVNGFTDAVKGQPHPTLSLARANAVRSYILAKTTGLKVSAIGLGLAASSSNSSAAMQESRKADIWVS